MILVAGVGNILREDDGIGIKVVKYLKQENLFQGIDYVDAGINTFRLLDIIKNYNKIIIIDAVNFTEKYCEVKLFNPEQFLTMQNNFTVSMHSFNLIEFFNFANFENQLNKKIHLIGIQPVNISYKNELSQVVQNDFKKIIIDVIKIINKILEK